MNETWPTEWKATHRYPNNGAPGTRSATTFVMKIGDQFYTRAQWARMTRIRARKAESR